MKQGITVFVIMVILLAAAPASAQNAGVRYDVKANVSTNASGTPVEVRAQVQAEARALQVEAEARKASTTDRRFELQSNIAKKRADNTFRVIEATIERLRNIANRVESRITKVESAGGVALESRAALAEARNHLSLAETSIAAFASVDLSGDDIRDKFDRVKTIAAEAKTHIREAHRALMRAVVALKPGFRTNNATSTRATSTATSTNQ